MPKLGSFSFLMITDSLCLGLFSGKSWKEYLNLFSSDEPGDPMPWPCCCCIWFIIIGVCCPGKGGGFGEFSFIISSTSGLKALVLVLVLGEAAFLSVGFSLTLEATDLPKLTDFFEGETLAGTEGALGGTAGGLGGGGGTIGGGEDIDGMGGMGGGIGGAAVADGTGMGVGA